MNLTTRSITAGSWLFSYNILARLAGILKTAIIARLLVPAQFGIFGIIAISLALLETFSETNFAQVLIQKKQLTEKHLLTSWYVTLVRGLGLSLILMLTAPLIALYFKQPGIETFIRWAALGPLIKALKNPRAILWQKKLDFKKEFILRSSGTLAELTIGILVSVLTRNVWGLVAAMLANAAGETVCSYFLIRPLRISWPSVPIAKELFRFSRWLWGSSILSYVATQGDDIVVGKLLGTEALGFYQNAYKIASLPATQLTGVVYQVTYPAYSLIQEDKTRLKRAYKKTLLLTIIPTLSFALIIICFASPLTYLFLGKNWLVIVPTLKILTIYGAIRAIVSTLGSLFYAVGQPKIITTHGIILVSALLLVIIPLTKSWGINGTAWACVISIFSSLPYLIFKAKQVLNNQ